VPGSTEPAPPGEVGKTDSADMAGSAGYRPLLFSIAYGMTGSVGDAEDIVQDAFLGLTRARLAGTVIADTKAYLTTAVTRLGINYLRSARVRRESYVGDWLPEPVVAPADGSGLAGGTGFVGSGLAGGLGPAEHAELADSLSMAFLVLLEALSPVERAVFMLREVFGYGYPDVARVTGKSEVNCRQIFARARQRIAAGGQAHDQPAVTGSSPPPTAATWTRCSPCSHRTWCSGVTAAARHRHSVSRWPAGNGCCGSSAGCSAAAHCSAPRSRPPGSTASRAR
jgi:RNA polymerase sigma factor (sigma-70 family)